MSTSAPPKIGSFNFLFSVNIWNRYIISSVRLDNKMISPIDTAKIQNLNLFTINKSIFMKNKLDMKEVVIAMYV
tara:strand:+ start:897 stop:1118 length:222 start_codon:yes stop_codon:yes gene_type:complete